MLGNTLNCSSEFISNMLEQVLRLAKADGTESSDSSTK